MNIIAARDVTVKTEKRLGTATIPLSFYNQPPQEELTLDEFELISLDRLQLLRALENARMRINDEAQVASKFREVNACSGSRNIVSFFKIARKEIFENQERLAKFKTF
jgi:hypothetical protein